MSYKTFFNALFQAPIVKAEEEEAELVDPQTTLREQCKQKPHIDALYQKYVECNDRVNSRTKTLETCAEELVDYVNELDHCVSHSLFSKLK